MTRVRPCPRCNGLISFQAYAEAPGVTAWLVLHSSPSCADWLAYYTTQRPVPWLSAELEAVKREAQAGAS